MDKKLIFLYLKSTSTRKNKFPEVIEFGAIKVTKEFKLESVFSEVVKPSLSELDVYTLAKTTVTQNEVDKAKNIVSVYEEFLQWAGPLEENAFIFWGKENYKLLTKELNHKNYQGNNKITKYFNFQSYLETKIGKELTISEALNSFDIVPLGNLHSAKDTSKNIFILYEKSIQVSDISDLWFSGKLLRIKSELSELKKVVLIHSKFESISETLKKQIDEIIGKCTVFLDLSKSFTKEEREIKLSQVRGLLDVVENAVEEVLINEFRKDSMPIQCSVLKRQLHSQYESIEDLKKHWEDLRAVYDFFNMNHRGTYSLNYNKFKDLYRSVTRARASFCESMK